MMNIVGFLFWGIISIASFLNTIIFLYEDKFTDRAFFALLFSIFCGSVSYGYFIT